MQHIWLTNMQTKSNWALLVGKRIYLSTIIFLVLQPQGHISALKKMHMVIGDAEVRGDAPTVKQFHTGVQICLAFIPLQQTSP